MPSTQSENTTGIEMTWYKVCLQSAINNESETGEK